MTLDELRTARLLFVEELAQGEIGEGALRRREVRDAVRARRSGPAPLRLAQRIALKAGLLGYDRSVTAPAVTARRAVLGGAADGDPRVLVRVDEFPHWKAWEEPEVSTEAYERFHRILTDAGVPYLLAVVPRTARRPEDPDVGDSRELLADQRQLLERLRHDGTSFGLHGLDHRTRSADPRAFTELGGLAPGALADRLDAGLGALAGLGLRTRVVVPPFNTFDRSGWPVLSRRFAVVTGGPESVRTVGFQGTPVWRGDAVYLPAYAPQYATAALVLPAVERLVAARARIWAPVVLHWGWERERGWGALQRLAEFLGTRDLARPWDALLDAVDASRDGVPE